MVLLLSVPNGAVDAQVDIDSPATGAFLARVVDLSGVPDPAFGTQLAWAINPGTGNDSGPGTPAAPLRTMAEFNRRYAAPLLISVAATLQLVGDVVDQPLWLRGSAFAPGGSLTVSGTVTPAGSATITLVTGLNTAGATLPPFQLTTTGIDWTTVPLGSRLLASNGSVAFIRNVIDANNVVTGAFTTLATASVVPTAALTLTVQSLSRIAGCVPTVQTTQTTVVLQVQDVSFDSGNISATAPFSGNILFFGCEIKTNTASTIATAGGMQIRATRFTMPAGSPVLTLRGGVGSGLSVLMCVCSGATTGTFTCNGVGGVILQHTVLLNSTLSSQANALCSLNSSCNIQHTTVGVIVDTNGCINAQTTVISGSAGISIGVDVRWGSLFWSGAANRPTLTGGTSDCRVGNVSYTYAALGNGKTAAFVDGIPPALTSTLIITTDPNRGPGTAVFSRAA